MEPMFTPAYKRYALVVLTTLYGTSLLDRVLMTLLLQPIKEDLHLSDTQLGLLTGFAFGLLYATLGVPMARWADRGNRITITSLTTVIGALTAAACFFVTSFTQLLLARIAAGVSDAGSKPLTYSLLGDYFPERGERTRAMYIWFLAGPLTAFIAWTSAGWLNEHYGWRLAFLLTGLVTLPLGLIAKWTLVEPRAVRNSESVRAPPLVSVFALLWRQSSCRHLTIAIVLLYMVGSGALIWKSAFMIRKFGIGTAELGVWLGVIGGTCGVICVLAGRYVVSRWFPEDERAQMRMAALSLGLGAPILIYFLLAPTVQAALVALVLLNLVTGVFVASPYAILQRLVPDEMRATALMIVMLLANLIGMGVGPLIVGGVSDLLTPRFGADGLRYAMMLGAAGWAGASYYFFMVARTVDRDLLATEYNAVCNPR
jgi:MFS family permease